MTILFRFTAVRLPYLVPRYSARSHLLYFLCFPLLSRVLRSSSTALFSTLNQATLFSAVLSVIVPATPVTYSVQRCLSSLHSRCLCLAHFHSRTLDPLLRCFVLQSSDRFHAICYHDRITLSLRVTPVPAVPNDTCRGRILTTTRPADMITYL